MRYFELYEKDENSIVIGLMKKAYESLSKEAKEAIDSWEHSNWTNGPLVQHFKANDEVAKEIENVFSPIRNKLPSKVKLYRGLKKEGGHGEWKDAVLESWTTDKRVAEHFAGLRRANSWKSELYDIKSDDEIAKAVSAYEKSGFVKFDNRYYVRNKEYPQYYNIYDSSKQFITDGDDLLKDLTNDNENMKELNQEKLDNAIVLEEDIDRDRIIWITNSVNCKEYIVKK